MKKLNWTLAGAWSFSAAFSALLFLLLSTQLAAQEELEVKGVLFEGNKAIAEAELSKVIKTRKGKEFNQRVHRVDKTLITNYYQLKGFLKVFVELDYRKEGDQIYAIVEGQVIQVL